jgi:Zn-finger nucleic acid-binding protein
MEKLRLCVDCEAEFVMLRRDSVRCPTCAQWHLDHGGRDSKLIARLERKAVERRELVRQEFGTTCIKVFEYEGQELAAGGKYQIVVGTRQASRLARCCHDCGQDDSRVRGQWAPAFSEMTGKRADRERIVLLCRACYERRCI